MKIFVAGGGSGKGLAVSNSTKKETFMKMVEVQAGLGMGIRSFVLSGSSRIQKTSMVRMINIILMVN